MDIVNAVKKKRYSAQCHFLSKHRYQDHICGGKRIVEQVAQ